VYSLYALLVLIWSSTWVAIKIGLEDCPPLLGAGVRFTLAGLVLLAIAAIQRRPLRTDWVLAGVLALAPFAFAYGLVYWGEQYVPSGLAAVLFGILPLYTALLGASALALAPLGAALGGIAQKRRAGSLDDAVVLNGWAMLVGGLLLLPLSGLSEDWGDFVWSAESVGSIAYLALFGSAIAFVTLTVLLRHISAMAVAFLAMLLPFGALIFGALLYDESITPRAVGGAALVAAGLGIAQWSRRSRAQPAPAAA
jgi:drug/metabolite transporter (DMT)-like permease